MNWVVTLIDSDGDEYVVDEPVGFDGINFVFNKSMLHHGIFNHVATEGFRWIKSAYDLLMAEYNIKGADGSMECLFEYECNGTYIEYFRGKFDFNTFKKQCSVYCFVECEITASKCVDIFLSRMGQDVNPDNTTNFDGDTIAACPSEDLLINGQTILLQNKADNNDGSDYGEIITDLSGTTGNRFYDIPLKLPNTPLFEIGDWNVNNVDPVTVFKNGGLDNITFPLPDGIDDFDNFYQFMYLYTANNDECVSELVYEWAAKGRFKVTPNYNGNITIALRVAKRNPITGSGLVDLGTVAIATSVALSNGIQTTIDFDESNSGTVTQPINGEYIHYYFHITIFKSTASAIDTTQISLEYDNGSVNFFNMTADSACIDSRAKSYLVPDLLEHFSKAYYSEECPQIEVEEVYRTCLEKYTITKGSMIRQVTEPSIPNLFTSFQYLFDNLNKTFNIGWGFDENDTVIKIGRPDIFYQSDIIANVGVLDKVTFTTALDLICGSVAVGYNKWEAEEYNGLDEMNTERYYRRNINSNQTQKDLLSDIIAAGYTIEITRRKNQGKTGTSDWRYDDDLFIINCFFRDGQLETQNGVQVSPSNIYDPDTRLNYDLTPARNMLRWLSSICAANPTIANDQLIFTKGTGNYLASGGMEEYCVTTDNVISESQTLTVGDIENADYNTPFWKPIYANFNAPLSMVQFEAVKANPYGGIQFSCFNTNYVGFIVELNHSPNNNGMASFKLLLRP